MYRRYIKWLVPLWTGLLLHAAAALDIIIVRHAETLANVSKDYSAFNQRHFTEDGLREIDALTKLMEPHRFDTILTSPAYRVLRTIQPYLEKTGQTAEIWPDLDECCWQTDRASERTPPGEPILLEQEQRPLFVLRAESPDLSPGGETYAEGVRRVKRAAADIKTRWSGTDAWLMIVVHRHTGARLIESLLDQAPTGRYQLENTRFTHLREENGRFALVELNGRALPEMQPAPTPAP